ncbi:MAG TPA: chemotaxis protein CheW [Geobacter sp.]|nr:chemotaxis protein CheW [Geobacter sp.]
MNLAEIRKKAQKGETQGEARAGKGPAAPAPSPYPEWQAPSLDDEPPASENPEPAAPAEPPPAFWLAEQPEEAEEFGFDQSPDEFDPAAVILKGRESALFDEDGSLQDTVAATVELLCFRVASEEYALNIMDIKEIIKPRDVTEVPRVPAFVRGILSLRGNIIPVFDMRLRLGLAGNTASERERVVVVKRQSGFCGVLVDEVVQVVRIAEAGIEPPPVVLEGIDREFVLGIGRVNGRMLILLDMEKVLDVGLL